MRRKPMEQLKDYITGLNLAIAAGVDVRCDVKGRSVIIEGPIIINEVEKCLDICYLAPLTPGDHCAQVKITTKFTTEFKDLPDELVNTGWVNTEVILHSLSDVEMIIESKASGKYYPKVLTGKPSPLPSEYPHQGWNFCRDEENKIISFNTYREAEEYLLDREEQTKAEIRLSQVRNM
jgi:hypothetical protein